MVQSYFENLYATFRYKCEQDVYVLCQSLCFTWALITFMNEPTTDLRSIVKYFLSYAREGNVQNKTEFGKTM